MNSHRSPKTSSPKGNLFFSKRVLGVDNFFLKLLIVCGMAVIFMVLSTTGDGCVWRRLFHIPCPGCGMTRAWRALLHGDVAGAFRWHFMFPVMPLMGAYFLYHERLTASRWRPVIHAVLWLVLVGFAVQWICRLVDPGPLAG